MMRTALFGTIAAILTASSYAAATQQDPPARPEVTACFTNTTHACVPVSSVTDEVPRGSFITFQLWDPSSVLDALTIISSVGDDENDGTFAVTLPGLPSYILPGSGASYYSVMDLKPRTKVFFEDNTTKWLPLDGFNTIPGSIISTANRTYLIPTISGHLEVPVDDNRASYLSILIVEEVPEKYSVNWMVLGVVDKETSILGDINRFTVGPKSNSPSNLMDMQPPELLDRSKSGASSPEMKGVGWLNVFSVGAALASLYLI
ncbi:hypothetical protein HDU85_006826 [Gaertneriomyces sp. JEL0708]|nr:hypothetical protein HDU85_006826 [Gaertneriomyces sp. JEL0708]